MADWLDGLGAELVVLAGYMAILDGAFIGRFAGRIVNVHPSLLPAFTGLHAVQQAIDYGVKLFGVTVHFVDEGVDTGPVILQDCVAIENAVDADAVLAALRPLEHRLLPEAVRLVAAGAVRPDPTRPRRMLVNAR
jgi:phosphoribosylglycinamide formyltransferase-1